ncbi:MAG: FadR/GntR family transcriptional regulator [Polyangiales bacterium]
MIEFSPISASESAPSACVEAIRRRILSGELSPGTRLPPERVLAEQLGVNRLTLRSALGQLAASNLLSVRQGSGYVVRAWRREGGPDLLSGLADLAKSPGEELAIARDLLAVRRALAQAVLERLAGGIGEAHRASITLAVEAYAARAEAGVTPEEAAELDLEVLAAILEATASPVFQLCLNPIATVLGSMPNLRAAMFEDARGGVAAYRVLCAWLASPEPTALPLVAAELARRDEITLERLARAKETKTARRRRS